VETLAPNPQPLTSGEAIAVTGLRLRYPETGQVVLKGVNLRLRRGEVKLLLGPSGAGKSSLALTLNGLIPHQMEGEIRGTVEVFGESTQEATVSWLTSQVGMVFQDPEAQIATLTVEDEVAFGMENLLVAPEAMPVRIAAALRRVGLESMEQRSTEALSGGQKQRLALASALAMGASVLVFDEPTANLDPAGASEFFSLLARLKSEGATILIIEHNLDELIPYVDSLDVLDSEGIIAASGTPREILQIESDRLEVLGVWKPQVSELADALHKRGVDILPYPLTVDEAAGALQPVLNRTQPAHVQHSMDDGREFAAQRAPRSSMDDGGQPRSSSADVRSGDVEGYRPSSIDERGALWAANSRPSSTISIEDLTYTFPDGTEALRGASLRIEQGAFHAIVGPNGSGKTTLARHMVGLLRTQQGAVRVLGDEVGRLSPGELSRRVAYVFQNPEHQFVTLNVYDELAYSLRARGISEAKTTEAVERLLKQFGLEERRRSNPFSLSQGQKRRLSVATMLALEPQVLILDEPTFGQDRRNARRIMEHLRELNSKGVTIVIITHDMKLVAEYATSLSIMVDGQVVFEGPPLEAFDDDALMGAASLVPPPIFSLSRRLLDLQPDFPLLASVEGAAEEICARSATCRGTASSTV
jgi:energy-coupling factor transport system ATP-binding protein